MQNTKNQHIPRALILLIIGGMTLCHATAQSTELEAIQESLSQVQSIQADFKQEKHIPILQKPLVSEGRFVFLAPRSMRWEYLHPLASLTILHQGHLRRWIRAGDGRMESIAGDASAMQTVFNDMLDWLGGRFTEGGMFTARLHADGRVILTPRQASMEAFVSEIEIHLSASADYVQTVVIHEGVHGYTRIAFANVVRNQPVDAGLFENGLASEQMKDQK